jgi:hypothetical protein
MQGPECQSWVFRFALSEKRAEKGEGSSVPTIALEAVYGLLSDEGQVASSPPIERMNCRNDQDNHASDSDRAILAMSLFYQLGEKGSKKVEQVCIRVEKGEGTSVPSLYKGGRVRNTHEDLQRGGQREENKKEGGCTIGFLPIPDSHP